MFRYVGVSFIGIVFSSTSGLRTSLAGGRLAWRRPRVCSLIVVHCLFDCLFVDLRFLTVRLLSVVRAFFVNFIDCFCVLSSAFVHLLVGFFVCFAVTTLPHGEPRCLIGMTNNQQQTTNNQQPTTNNDGKQPTTNSKGQHIKK